MALALVAACWLTAPAAAADLPAAVQAPVADVIQVAGQASPAADVQVAAAGNALASSVDEASSTVERVVADATETVADTGAPPAVQSAIGTVGPPPPSAPTGHPFSMRDGGAGVGAKASTHAYRAQHRGAPPRRRSAARHALPVGPPAGPVTDMEVGGASRGTVAGPVHSQKAGEPSVEPVSGLVGGSPASGASAGMFFGGLAILLTAFLVAAPRLRRGLPGRRAFCPLAAFVPFLERPG